MQGLSVCLLVLCTELNVQDWVLVEWCMCAVMVVIASRMDNHDLLANTSSGFLNIPRCSSYCTVTVFSLDLL